MIDRKEDAAGGLVRDRPECNRCVVSGRWILVERSFVAAPHIRWHTPIGGVMSRRVMPKQQIVWGVSK